VGESPSVVGMPPIDNREHGVFATRSPGRPNPIGLTVVELHRREGSGLHVQGADMLDGTPILNGSAMRRASGLHSARSVAVIIVHAVQPVYIQQILSDHHLLLPVIRCPLKLSGRWPQRSTVVPKNEAFLLGQFRPEASRTCRLTSPERLSAKHIATTFRSSLIRRTRLVSTLRLRPESIS